MSSKLRTPMMVFGGILAAASAFSQSAYFSTAGESSFVVVNASSGDTTARFVTGLGSLDFAINPGGTEAYLANQYEGAVVKVSLPSGKRIGTIGPAGIQPVAVALSADGSKLYVAILDHAIAVINVATGTTLQTVSTGPFSFNDGFVLLAVTPDGTKAYLSTRDSVLGFDLVNGTALPAIAAPKAQRFAISPTGDRLYVSSNRSQALVYIVDTASDDVVNTVPGGQGANDVAVSSDGITLYIAATNGLTVASAANGCVSAVIPSKGLRTVALSPDGVAACAVSDYSPMILERFNLSLNTYSGASLVHGIGVQCAYSHDGTNVYDLLHPDYNVAALNTVSQKVTNFIPGAATASATISGDGKTLVEPDYGILFIIDTPSKKQVRSVAYTAATNSSVAVSNDGTMAFVPSGTNPVVIDELSLKTGTLVNTIPLVNAANQRVFVALSPDGATLYLIYGNGVQNLCAANVATATIRACQTIPGGGFSTEIFTRALTVSGDGTRIYAMSGDYAVGEFDADTLQLLRTTQIADPSNSALDSLVLSTATNSLFLTAYNFTNQTGSVVRVDAGTFAVVAQLALSFEPLDAAVSSDGTNVYLSGSVIATPVLDGLTLVTKPGVKAPGYTTGVVSGPF